MDTLFVLNNPIKNYKLKSKFIGSKRKRAMPKPYNHVSFAPDVLEQPACGNKISFVQLYNELCSEKRTSKSKFKLDEVRNPVQNTSVESIVTLYNSGGDMKVYKQSYAVVPRTDSTAKAEVMFEIDYGT